MDQGGIAFIIVCCIFIFFMTPGLAVFYGGLVRGKNAVGIMEEVFISIAVVGILWAAAGFSLTFGESLGGLVGDLSYLMMRNVDMAPSPLMAPELPFILFFTLQLVYAIITPALIAGAVAGRMAFKAYVCFIALWLLIVYCPVGNWIWGGGWLASFGVLDFAGGLTIHLAAGVSAFVAAYVLGPRNEIDDTPCNMAYVTIGAGIVWAGWFAFNGASALSANNIASLAVANTLLASCAAIPGWIIIRLEQVKKVTLLDTMTGGIAGLVAITPLAGYISPAWAMPVGFFGAAVCAAAARFRRAMGLDDALDVWALHGVGGAFGLLAAGLLADPLRAPYAGALYGGAFQLVRQGIAVAAVLLYAAAATFVILKIISLAAPLRVSAAEEELGLDLSVHGERLQVRD
ncbi:MAG: ammonium transporter [Synergistaceae bacterium]|nr:ammonium transporter [Synergistaceae bacterium]